MNHPLTPIRFAVQNLGCRPKTAGSDFRQPNFHCSALQCEFSGSQEVSFAPNRVAAMEVVA